MAYNHDMDAGGVKNDAGKIRMELNPVDALMASAVVFTHGAVKYDDWNWAKGMPLERLIGSSERHLAAIKAGEYYDPDSGLPHMWHFLCNAMMMTSLDLRLVNEDEDPFADLYESHNGPRANLGFERVTEIWEEYRAAAEHQAVVEQIMDRD